MPCATSPLKQGTPTPKTKVASCAGMRVALAVVLFALFAGCLADDPPLEVEEEPMPEPIPELPPGATVIEPPAPGVTAQAARVALGFEMADMAFNNSLTRVAIIANGTATVEVSHWVAAPASAKTDACGASAITHIEDGEVAKNAVSAYWMRPQRNDAEVRLAGTGVGGPDTSDDGATGIQAANWTASYRLRAGDQVIVEMGGRDPGFLAAPEHSWRYDINATGPVRVVPLPDREIRCGTGTYQAAGTLHAHGFLTDAAVDTRVALNATTAGTIQFGAGVAGDTKRVEVEFLGDTYSNPKFLAEAREGGGEIVIHFTAWPDALAAGRWLMADAYWPNIGN